MFKIGWIDQNGLGKLKVFLNFNLQIKFTMGYLTTTTSFFDFNIREI
jgi:hypothetical protein